MHIKALYEKLLPEHMSPKEKWMLVFLLGLLVAVVVFPMDNQKKEQEENVLFDTTAKEEESSLNESQAAPDVVQSYELYLSKELEKILTQMEGAGQVTAWVTLSGSSEKILSTEANTKKELLEEADSVGGSRKEENVELGENVFTDSDGIPYVIKTLQPAVEGVLVLAEGAENSLVKKNITEAIQVLFGIDAHRIKVAKKSVEE